MESLKIEYLDDLRGLNRSPRTIETADLRLSYFVSWLAGREISQKVIKAYRLHLIDKFPSPFTAKTWMGTTRAFLNWAASDEVDEESRLPQFTFKTVSTPRLIRDIISRSDITALENGADNVRDKLIIRILADTGVRVSELVQLEAEDTKLLSGHYYLRVHGKGAKDRDVPITPNLYRRISRGSGLLFTSIQGRTKGSPMTVHAVQQMLKKLGVKILNRSIHPHLFRHTFITQMLLEHVDPVRVAQVVGHADIKMIWQVYNQLKSTDAADAVINALSSADKKRGGR